MIVAKEPIIEYIKNQESVVKFAARVGVTPKTIYSILNGGNVSSKMFLKLLDETGYSIEKAFELKKELAKE